MDLQQLMVFRETAESVLTGYGVDILRYQSGTGAPPGGEPLQERLGVLVRLEGDLAAEVVLGASSEDGARFAARIAHLDEKSVDQALIWDALCELANVILGHVTSRLSLAGIKTSISTPTRLEGGAVSRALPLPGRQHYLTLHSSLGTLSLWIGSR